jgi:hypothetical protein
MALTWKQFKNEIERIGVKDDTVIDQIDMYMPRDLSVIEFNYCDESNSFSADDNSL